jgi:hypothetical protein
MVGVSTLQSEGELEGMIEWGHFLGLVIRGFSILKYRW